ncbi:MAG: hypothetical protein H0U98_12615 [Alphaproteobacteria bacterium]|nr:hypothetical protein [Alphaproteobacteria bacterium]
MRAYAWGLALLVLAAPAAARLWKPTPPQVAMDYATISHIKGTEGRVIVTWMAAPLVPAPTMQPLLDRYVVISIVHTRQGAGGAVTWDDIEGVQVTDGNGQALKEVTPDTIPPSLVGMTASAEAAMRQSTQGKGKMHWGIYEAGAVNACRPGKLVVAYDGEQYSWDTPMPGCPKT